MTTYNKSIIIYNGFNEKSFCGYCKKYDCSYSHGMWASCLSVQAYQDMIDLGWRRSGKYCYKSLMNKTCCPQYTIRCEALRFQLSKSQKKVIKKVTHFLKCGEDYQNLINIEHVEREPLMKYDSHVIHDGDHKMQIMNTDQLHAEEQCSSSNDLQNRNSLVNIKEYNNMAMSLNCNAEALKETKKIKPGKGADPNLPRCKKKKTLRIEKKLAKHPTSVTTTLVSQQKSLEDFIAENDSVFADEVKKLRIILLKLTQSSHYFEAEYAVYKLYQNTVHGDTDDQCTREQFIRFLVNSPLRAEKADHPDHPGYGTFHQQYWLGEKLIAVGVLDILPKCVSSVYFFYDPNYQHMALGTYSSLREIFLVRHLSSLSPDLKYYYMGFYIHSCSKMRYKAKFQPSFLLCPLRYTWHAIDKCLEKLDKEKYSTFDESEDVENEILEIENIQVFYSGSFMPYSSYRLKKNSIDQENLVTEYIKLVGSKLARQLIFAFVD